MVLNILAPKKLPSSLRHTPPVRNILAPKTLPSSLSSTPPCPWRQAHLRLQLSPREAHLCTGIEFDVVTEADRQRRAWSTRTLGIVGWWQRLGWRERGEPEDRLASLHSDVPVEGCTWRTEWSFSVSVVVREEAAPPLLTVSGKCGRPPVVLGLRI